MDQVRKSENNNPKHRLELINRANISIDGVEHVASFDEAEISLLTNMGMLILKGEGMHITQLNLESGSLAVEGKISSMVYEVVKPNKNFKERGKGIIDRILR